MNTIKRLVTFIITTIFCQSAFAAQQVTAEYLETTELLSIVSHLAGIPGYDWDKDLVLSGYVAEVDSVFTPYRNHMAVKFVAKKLLNKGFTGISR